MRNIKILIFVLTMFINFKDTLLQFLHIRPLRILQSRNSGLTRTKDVSFNFIELIEKYGFPAEEHELETQDLYRLRVHRIPGSPSNPKRAKKPVVYIQHGLLGLSSMFVLGGPDKDLAFMLADAGYDVWLGNARGNTYSRSHAELSPDRDSKFWEFSFHEIAVYDIAATIDYILELTHQTSLTYVGHSMGSTLSIVLLSARPEYNQKIHLVINMAGVYNWKDIRPHVKFLRDNGRVIKKITEVFGLYEILPHRIIERFFANNTYCEEKHIQPVCVNIALYLNGYNADLDLNILTNAYPHFPAGVSRNTLIHLYQNMLAEKLQMFDYGSVRNLVLYGTIRPPPYNVENIFTRVVLIYGKSDTFASPEDSIELSNNLKNSWHEMVPYNNFSHIDFVWGKNIKSLLQNRVLQIIMNN